MQEKILLKNAIIYNNDYTQNTLCNILIENGIIVGIEKGCSNYSDAKQIDLKGKLLLPSFIDSHLHIPGNMLYDNFGINLTSCKDIEDYIRLLRNMESQKYEVIRGFGWNEVAFHNDPELVKKFKEEVDSIFEGKPVIIYSTDFHSCFCNTRALEICNINQNTSVPFGGNIDKTQSGELTGIIREQAIEIVKEKLDILGFSKEEMKVAILKYQEKLLSYGITAVSTFMFIGGDYQTEWEILKKLEEQGLLKIKVNGSIPVSPNSKPEEIVKKFMEMQKYNSEKIRINTAKIYMDGVLDTRTAYLNEPYENTNYCGESLWEDEKLRRMVEYLDKNGIQIHVHSIGDGASRQIVNAISNAIRKNKTTGERSNRHTITHLQLIDDEDICKMGENGIIAALQPFWFSTDKNGETIDYETLGIKRVDEQYKLKSFIEKGVVVTSSSDSPVTENFNPILGIYQATNRNNVEQRATIGEMIKTFTINGAYQLKKENEIGKIAVGKKADLVVIDDILKMNPQDIKNAQLQLCLNGGEIVYRKEREEHDCEI